jgi:hypothetical protein
VETRKRETQAALFACLLIHAVACGGSDATDLATSTGGAGMGGTSVAGGGTRGNGGSSGGNGGALSGSGGRAGDDGGLGFDVSIGGAGGNAGSGGARPTDASVTDTREASATDAHAGEASTQEARLRCIEKCEDAHAIGASSASLIASDCCGGTCASSCPSAACLGMSGIFGQPYAKVTCQTCAIMPYRAGTCAAGCREGDCKAYLECVSACL